MQVCGYLLLNVIGGKVFACLAAQYMHMLFMPEKLAEQLSPELGADTASEGLQREPVGAVKSEGHGGVALKTTLVQQNSRE